MQQLIQLDKETFSTIATYVAASSPSTPQAFTITSQSITEIDLSWSAPSTSGGCNIIGYNLYMQSVDSPGYSLIYDGSTNSYITTYAVIRPVITSSKTYIFCLKSINCGYSSSNVTLMATAAGVPSAPTNVALLLAISTTSASISWQLPTTSNGMPISSFNIYKDNTLFLNVLGGSITSATLTGLSLGVTYKIEVSAINSVGESAKSTPFYLLFANVPGSPTNFILTSTITSITASWQAPFQL